MKGYDWWFKIIEEIRIMSKTGANIFSGKVNLESSKVETSETDVLFAGFISAILSVSEELQDSDIRELGYQDNKIIFTLTDNLIFLGFADTRVPNDDIQTLLDDIIRRWLKEYKDKEYPFIPDEMRTNILSIIQESIKDVFWWSSPEYNLTNNFNLIKGIFSNPSGSYFVQYLPKTYLITGMVIFLLTLIGGHLSGTAFTGFSSGPPIQGSPIEVSQATTVTLILFLFGTALSLKVMFRDNFNLLPFLTLGGVYSILLLLFLLFTSEVYIYDIYLTTYNLVEQNVLLSYTVQMFLFFAPINLTYFGFIIIHMYASSVTNTINTVQYFGGYLISVLLIISIAEFYAGGILGVIPLK